MMNAGIIAVRRKNGPAGSTPSRRRANRPSALEPRSAPAYSGRKEWTAHANLAHRDPCAPARGPRNDRGRIVGRRVRGRDQSASPIRLSLSDPLRLREISPRHYAVKGTPTDCIGMRMIADPDQGPRALRRRPQPAADVTYSGTIAGAMEGAMLGIPSIAPSQAYAGVHGRTSIKWDSAEAHAAPLIARISRGRPRAGRLYQRELSVLCQAPEPGQGGRLLPPGPAQRRADAARGATGAAFPITG